MASPCSAPPCSRDRWLTKRQNRPVRRGSWIGSIPSPSSVPSADGQPAHYPRVIASLLQPALFDRRHINVEIETKSELTPGMTVADGWRMTGHAPNAMLMGGVDRDGFCRLLTKRLGRL